MTIAGNTAPIRLKKSTQRNESHHPKPNKVGPRYPRASAVVQQLKLKNAIYSDHGL